MRITTKQSRTLAIFLAITMSILHATAVRARDSSAMKRIVVFGDSLSAGYLLKQSQAWPMLLADKLRGAGLNNFVIENYSESGGTTTMGLKRLGRHLDRKIDIFILELGVNDALISTPIHEIHDHLQEIIDRVKRANPNVRLIICGMQFPDRADDSYGERFGKMYVDLAEKNHAALVPFLLDGVFGNPELNLFDHVHPNAAGHKILVENVWRVLEPVARETSNQHVAHVQ
jgi:acyl-CoA thioesterase I